MKFLSSIVISITMILPISAQEQTFSYEKLVAQDIGKQVLCMAKNLYYEAAKESFEGKLAVANVVMNRVNNPQFPKTVCDVVYQKINNTYQFSWVGEKVGPISNKYAWEECIIIAKKSLTEMKLHDTIFKSKAMYYHNTSVNPQWKLKKVTQIGNHIFYSKG